MMHEFSSPLSLLLLLDSDVERKGRNKKEYNSEEKEAHYYVCRGPEPALEIDPGGGI